MKLNDVIIQSSHQVDFVLWNIRFNWEYFVSNLLCFGRNYIECFFYCDNQVKLIFLSKKNSISFISRSWLWSAKFLAWIEPFTSQLNSVVLNAKAIASLSKATKSCRFLIQKIKFLIVIDNLSTSLTLCCCF